MQYREIVDQFRIFIVILFLCILGVGLIGQFTDTLAAESTIDSVTMLVPNVWAMPGDTIRLPVMMLEDVTGSAIFSVSLDFTFDPDVVALAGDSVVTDGTVSQEWLTLFVYNKIDANTLRMVWAATDSLENNGPFVFITLRVHPTASLGQSSALLLEICSINEGYPTCNAIDGILGIGDPPRIEISELTHDFGTVPIYQSKDWILRITNTGDHALDIYHLHSDEIQFEIITPPLPHSISANESVDAMITFKPVVEDTVTGNVRIFCNDLVEPIVDIPVQGTGGGTRVQLSSFSARRQGKDVILKWSTTEEVNHLGYYVYRSHYPDRDFRRVHSELITGNSTYAFCDKTADGYCTYYYKLNALDTSGCEEPIGFTVVKGFQSAPTDFFLTQNYPNPFNPLTTIIFGIPEKGFLTIIVYNTLGQEVRTLYNGVAESGHYSVSWDGTDKMGNVVPSGVYFYKLKTQGVSISRQMLLLR